MLAFFSSQLSVNAFTELESNNQIENANTILLNEIVNGVASTSEDKDYYKIQMTKKGILQIDFPKVENVNFDIQIRKKDTPVFSWDFIGGKDGSFQYGVEEGTYYIYVGGRNLKDKSSENAYSFNTSFIEIDNYEAEYNDEIAYANPTNPHILYSGRGSTTDRDFFAIKGEANKMLNVTVAKGHALLYNSEGKIVDTSASSPSREIAYPINNEMYYLSIGSTSDYTFSYTFENRSDNYEYESNDSYDLAYPIHLNKTYFGQSDTSQDRDFYQFKLVKDGLVSIDMNTYEKAIYSISFYDKNGNMLIKERRTNRLTDETLSVGLAAGTYSVSIEPFMSDDMNHLYAFNITVDSSRLYDQEDNRSIAKAQSLSLNEVLYGKAYTSDESTDYYKVQVDENGLLNLALKASDATTQAYIYSEDGVIIDFIQMDANGTGTLRTGVKAGTYFINIYSFGTSKDFYTLKATVITSDNYEIENNNTKDAASVLTFNQFKTGQIDFNNNSFDVDWYTFTLAKSTLTNLKFTELEKGSVYVTLYDDNENIIKRIRTEHTFDHLETYETQLKKGTYYIQVEQNYGPLNVDYHLSFNISTVASFIDVPSNHPYYKEISLIREMGIINGYANGTFATNEKIKRHHVAAMIFRSGIDGLAEYPTYRYLFPDVSTETHPNAFSIQLLMEAGIIDWNPNGFNPNNTLTRAQLAKMLVKAYNLELNTKNIQTFKDVSNQAWYNDYIKILASHNITTGDNGYFKPNAPVTRQHFAVFLYRTLKAIDEIE